MIPRRPMGVYLGAPVLPAGAIGVWYADAYSASPRPVVPNALAVQPPSGNLFAAPRRLFSTAFAPDDFWNPAGCTIVDEAVTGPDGTGQASTCNATGNWFIASRKNHTVPSGNYTIAISAKRNTGSDQVFAFTKDNTGTHSATKTATASWQRFSYSFNLASPAALNTIFICSIDGSTAANLQICNYELFAGMSDLGPAVLDGHLYPGISAFDPDPSCSGGILDLDSTSGLIQFPVAAPCSTITAMAVVKKTASHSSYEGILVKVQNYQQFSLTAWTGGVDVESRLDTAIAGANGALQGHGLFDLYDDGFHVLTFRCDGTHADYFIDDVLLLRNTGTPSSVNLADLFVGTTGGTGLPWPSQFNALALWDSALSDGDVRQAVTVLKARAAVSSITVNTLRVYVAEGDSITEATTPLSYAYKFGANDSPKVFGANYAVSGSGLPEVEGRAATVDLAATDAGGRTFILSIFLGANELRSYAGASDAIAAADWGARLAAYCDARRAAGFKVVVCTVLPYYNAGDPTGTAAHNARRAIVNADIVANWTGVHCDDVADFAGDGTMGPDAAATNATYYPDGQHPSDAGHVILETILRPIVNGL